METIRAEQLRVALMPITSCGHPSADYIVLVSFYLAVSSVGLHHAVAPPDEVHAVVNRQLHTCQIQRQSTLCWQRERFVQRQ